VLEEGIVALIRQMGRESEKGERKRRESEQ
jgi:hypothetical protein